MSGCETAVFAVRCETLQPDSGTVSWALSSRFSSSFGSPAAVCRAAGLRVVSRKAENRHYGEEQLWLPDTSVPVSRWVVTAATAASSGEMHGTNGQRERGLFIFCSECLSRPVMIVRVIRCKWMFSRLLALVSAADKWLLCEARAAFGPGDREVFLCASPVAREPRTAQFLHPSGWVKGSP